MHRKLSLVIGLVIMAILTLSLVACSSPAQTTTTAPVAPTSAPKTSSAPASSAPATSTAPASTAGKTINLKWAVYHPPTTYEAKLCQDFANEIKTETNGQVQIQVFTGGSLLTAPNMADGIINGVADIGEGSLDYTPGKFPETELALTPLGSKSPWIITHAVNDFYNKYESQEWAKKGLHMLWMWGNGPAVLMTKTPVKTIDDLKPLKIRAQGQNGVNFTALGGNSTNYDMSELYDGISKGVVDGVFVDPSVLVSFKLGDVVKDVTDTSIVGNSFIFYIPMNLNTWNSLPANIQTIFTKVASDWVEKSAVAINQEDIDGINYAKKAGDQFIKLSDSEAARWKTLAAPVAQNYVNKLISQGFAADAENAHLQYFLSQIATYTTQQTTNKIPFPLQ